MVFVDRNAISARIQNFEGNKREATRREPREPEPRGHQEGTRREPERTNEKQEAIMQEPRANQEGTRREPRGKKPRENQEQTKRETKGKPEDSQRKAKDTTSGDHRAQVPPPMIDENGPKQAN